MHATKRQPKAVPLAENAIARKVLEEIQKIDAEAKQKKLAQLDSLEQARDNIHQRIRELGHQIEQINKAIEAIGGNALKGSNERTRKRERRNLDELRDRVIRWMEGHKNEKYAARNLVREFPELEGTPMSIFLKPLLQAGKIKTDTSEGVKRTKYFVSE